jgi:hypothetical protein
MGVFVFIDDFISGTGVWVGLYTPGALITSIGQVGRSSFSFRAIRGRIRFSRVENRRETRLPQLPPQFPHSFKSIATRASLLQVKMGFGVSEDSVILLTSHFAIRGVHRCQ